MKINSDIEASKSDSSKKRTVQYRVHNKAGVRVVAVVIATEVVVQILQGGQQEEGMVENVVEAVVDPCQKSVQDREFLIMKSDYRYSAE